MDDGFSALWDALASVRLAKLRCGKERGESLVSVAGQEGKTLLFQERGVWEKSGLSFTNALLWSAGPHGIFLERFRWEEKALPFSFFLVPKGENSLVSSRPCFCKEDCYTVDVSWDSDSIHLLWQVTGPKKSQAVEVRYLK